MRQLAGVGGFARRGGNRVGLRASSGPGSIVPRGSARSGGVGPGAWNRAGPLVRFAVFALTAAAPATPISAQDGRREIEEGNRLYDEGRFQEAHARYLEALEKVPGLALARFNEGNALYRSQEFQRAMEAYLEALENGDPGWQSDAWYNLGNAMLRQQQPGPALEAYKQALRLDPADLDAKHNLEMALRMLEQQEQQQQGGEGQDGDDRNRDEQQQQGDQPRDGRQGRERSDPSEGRDEGEEGRRPQPRDGQRDGESARSNEEQEGEGRSGEQPPRMTPEQAERLLQAVTEDPGEVNRKTAQARGRRPRKDW